jgi:hypothetical protein
MAVWKSPAKKKRQSTASAQSDASTLADLATAPTADEVPTLVTARANALDAFGFELKPAQMIEAAKRSRELSDAVQLRVLQPQEEQQVACRKGCFWCCTLKVGVTVPEVMAIVAHLEAAPEQLEVVRKRAAELAKDPRILSDTEKPKARIGCALLTEDGSCGVYAVRPIPCRGWLSTDVESCKKHLDGEGEPRFVLSVARNTGFVQLGLAKAMDDIERYPYLVELTSGLDIALNEPNAIERWLAGEPVFQRASSGRSKTDP